MADGMTYDSKKCLKVGFLNDQIDARIDHYVDIFDIVILGDEAGKLFKHINVLLEIYVLANQ